MENVHPPGLCVLLLAISGAVYDVYKQKEEASARVRTIFKGSFIRQTMYNKLLPCLMPQPMNIGGMIRSRRDARERRFEKREELYGWLDDFHGEAKFERKLWVRKNDSQKMEFVEDALKE